MFWKWFHNVRVKRTNYNLIVNAIIKVEQFDCTYISRAYCAFAFNEPVLVKQAGKAARSLLNSYSTKDMIRLSEQMRQFTSLEWYVDWSKVFLAEIKGEFESEEDYICALMLGTFHPNGYFREKCMLELMSFPDSLFYFVLRLNDWVDAIRVKAVDLVNEKLQECTLDEVFRAIPAIDKVKKSKRRNAEHLQEIERQVEARMVKEASELTLNSIIKYEYSMRKGIYRILFSNKLLSIEMADYLLSRERHSFCQLIIITGILKYYNCSNDQLDVYLQHKNSTIRRRVLEYKFDKTKSAWPGLEHLLLDSNYGVRQFAVYILERYSDFDILDFYKVHLQDENPAISILGIGECGKKEMSEYINSFLLSDNKGLVRNTILALSKLLAEEGENIYWDYLFDSDISVSRASYRSICVNSISYGAETLYNTYKNQQEAHIKRHLILLMVRERQWERLPYLIYLYCDSSVSALHETIATAMQLRNMYAKVEKRQWERIEEAMEACAESLPAGFIEEVRFEMKYVLK